MSTLLYRREKQSSETSEVGSLSPGHRVNPTHLPAKFMYCLGPTELPLSGFLTWNIHSLDPITASVNEGGVGWSTFLKSGNAFW